MAASEDKESKRVMDVQKPGSTAADAGSRPVIIRHKSSFQDPMVKSDSEESSKEEVKETSEEPVAAVKTTGKKIIAPIPEDKPEEGKETEAADQAKDDAPAPEASKEESKGSGPSTSSDSAAVDVLAEQAGSKKQANEISEEEQKKQEAVQKLIEEKKYFVPISQARKKRRKFWASVVFLLIALGAGGYLAINNGIFSTAPADSAGQEAQADSLLQTGDIAEEGREKSAAEQSSSLPTVVTPEDQERQGDLKLISSALEAYYEEKKRYPSFDELNDESFRKENLQDLRDEDITDPENDTAGFAAKPADTVYVYAVTDADDKECDNETSVCARYVLTATLSTKELLELKNHN